MPSLPLAVNSPSNSSSVASLISHIWRAHIFIPQEYELQDLSFSAHFFCVVLGVNIASCFVAISSKVKSCFAWKHLKMLDIIEGGIRINIFRKFLTLTVVITRSVGHIIRQVYLTRQNSTT